MYQIEAVIDQQGELLFTVAEIGGDVKSRGLPTMGDAFTKVSTGIGAIALSLANGLSSAKDATKEVTVELAFEVVGGLDIKLVKFTEKSQIKLILKL